MKLVIQGGKTDYNYKEWYFDSSKGESYNNLNTNSMCEGSIAFDMKTGNVYMLNSEKEWVKL